MAEAGDASAQFILGLMYDNGDGVLKDSAEAVKWYRKSAEQGNANAQNNLGLMYNKGDVVLKDSAEARKWFRKSAEQGNANAQNNLGLMYDNGDDTHKDSWVNNILKGSFLYAIVSWVNAILTRGTPKDSVEAHAWYNNASANGDEAAKKNLSDIEKTMTPDQISDANKLAREIFNRISTKKN